MWKPWVRRTLPVLAPVVALLVQGCGGSGETVDPATKERAQGALAPFKQELQAALLEGMREGGAANAIDVCRVMAPEIAERNSVDGITMGRTSHRLRNPGNAPEAWMTPLLEHYIEHPGDPEPRTVRLDGSTVGYVEPIYVKSVCLGCHGEDIDPGIRSVLAESYPQDQATGFAADEFRGLFWVKLPAGPGGS